MTLLQLYKGDKFMKQSDYDSSSICSNIEWRVMAKSDKGVLAQNIGNNQIKVMKHETMIVKMK